MIEPPGTREVNARGLYAIIPTPARPGAERWDATDTVDLDETARVVERLIADGAAGLIALGTTGECATLTATEYEAFVDCVLRTIDRRVPAFIGATALGLHEVIRRLRFVRAGGATGTLLGLPMWQPCTLEMAIGYYAMVAEAFPDLEVMVYANERAFRFPFDAAFWRALPGRAATARSAKYSRPATYLAAREASAGRVQFIPNEGAALAFERLAPGTVTACWATAASMGPAPAIALIEAILAGDLARSEAIDRDIAWANEPFKIVHSSPELFASYNIQMEKLRIDAAGYCHAGPIRPPYDVMPPEYATAAAECGRRWTDLCRKYAVIRA